MTKTACIKNWRLVDGAWEKDESEIEYIAVQSKNAVMNTISKINASITEEIEEDDDDDDEDDYSLDALSVVEFVAFFMILIFILPVIQFIF